MRSGRRRSVAALAPGRAAASGKVTVAKAGENRFAFANAAQAGQTPCKVTSEDSGGACTIFEMNVLPKSGPFLHAHHREDEWYYALSGEFLFRAGGEDLHVVAGRVHLAAPRDTACVGEHDQRGGEVDFDVPAWGIREILDGIGNVPMDKKSPEVMKELMAKYGMEMLGPPIFASSWVKAH